MRPAQIPGELALPDRSSNLQRPLITNGSNAGNDLVLGLRGR